MNFLEIGTFVFAGVSALGVCWQIKEQRSSKPPTGFRIINHGKQSPTRFEIEISALGGVPLYDVEITADNCFIKEDGRMKRTIGIGTMRDGDLYPLILDARHESQCEHAKVEITWIAGDNRKPLRQGRRYWPVSRRYEILVRRRLRVPGVSPERWVEK